jgi:hypothetical protein
MANCPSFVLYPLCYVFVLIKTPPHAYKHQWLEHYSYANSSWYILPSIIRKRFPKKYSYHTSLTDQNTLSFVKANGMCHPWCQHARCCVAYYVNEPSLPVSYLRHGSQAKQSGLECELWVIAVSWFIIGIVLHLWMQCVVKILSYNIK